MSDVPLIERIASIRAVLQQLKAEFEEKSSVTPPQALVLRELGKQEHGLSQQALVDMTGIDRSTLSDVVRRLVEKGALKRLRTKNDQRSWNVTLTEEGRLLLEDVLKI